MAAVSNWSHVKKSLLSTSIRMNAWANFTRKVHSSAWATSSSVAPPKNFWRISLFAITATPHSWLDTFPSLFLSRVTNKALSSALPVSVVIASASCSATRYEAVEDSNSFQVSTPFLSLWIRWKAVERSSKVKSIPPKYDFTISDCENRAAANSKAVIWISPFLSILSNKPLIAVLPSGFSIAAAIWSETITDLAAAVNSAQVRLSLLSTSMRLKASASSSGDEDPPKNFARMSLFSKTEFPHS
mmetsp:Transcript_71235/g.128253  ORF Transcript_71235/g.128253 Transcript_71235/m.128253 type:complete len:244 (-) Transcript_71235:218-949(-)